jgi:hypothetical protein
MCADRLSTSKKEESSVESRVDISLSLLLVDGATSSR